MPEKTATTKYRKWQKRAGAHKGAAQRCTRLCFGAYGLKLLSSGRLRGRQIEAARVAIKRIVKNRGKLWIRQQPNKPVTSKPAEVPMGKGKGAVDHYVREVRAGSVLFEIDGVEEELARQAVKKASYKLPFVCKFIKK